MIYYVGNPRIFDSEDETIVFKSASIEESLQYLEELEEVGLDLETEGFDPYTKKILTLQLGDGENQYVINALDIDITKYYKKYIESRLIIGQNLKFDIRFLYKYNIIPTQIYDTYIAECILYNNDDKFHRKGLDALAMRYCNVFLDKTIRGEIHRGLTPRVIKYAAEDVLCLHSIKEKQLELAHKLQLYKAIELDNLFVPVLAYVEMCGFKLDRNLWDKKIQKNREAIKQVEEALNKFIIDNNIYQFIDRQLDLFNPDIKVSINWNSSSQVIKLFKILGIDTTVVEDGENKESVGAKNIQSQIDKFPIVGTYLKFKELQKDLSTYGENFYRHINPVTQRIHTNFNQLMNTGRMSCGGKDKARRIDYINLQNIPSDADTRKCFICNEGNVLIDCDYSGQEDIVFVNKSLEPKLIEFYLDTTRERDGHSFVAKMCFPKELANIAEEDVKKLRSDLRKAAKSAKFAIHYGGNGFTIAVNLNIPKKDGEDIYNAYLKNFSGIKQYFDWVSSTSLKNGYITFNNITGRKFFIRDIEDFRELSSRSINSLSEFEKKKFYAIKGEIYRKSLNYPIQGTSGDITKYAGILLFRKILETNMFGKVLIPNVIHDEYLVETSTDIAEEWAKILQESMEKAGALFCTTVPLKAEPCITPYWTH